MEYKYHGSDTPIILRQIKKAMRYPNVHANVRYAFAFNTIYLWLRVTGEKRTIVLEAGTTTNNPRLIQYYDFVTNTFIALANTEDDNVVIHLPVTVSNIETEVEKIKAAFVKAVNQPGKKLKAHVMYIHAGTPQVKHFNRHGVIESANIRTKRRAATREIAARRIQRAWKDTSSNPHNPIGYRMLMREFRSHIDEDK